MVTPNPGVTVPRIISLLPSATEIVCALGAEKDLVGVSHECDFPSTIEGRPALTQARVRDDGTSLGIDRQVRGVVEEALSIYTVDHELLARLRPDVIVTQDLCEVCAVSLEDVRAAVARIADQNDVEIVSLSPTRLEHILSDVERVAVALGRKAEGETLLANLRHRIAGIAERSAQIETRPRVASLEWIDPVMLGGTWMPEVINIAGGVAVGVEAGDPAPTVTPNALASLAPDVVVVKACGFSIDRTMQEREAIEDKALGVLDPKVPVYVTDGNAFFNRPGPRIVESIEIMAAVTNPSHFEDFAERHADSIVRVR